MVCVKEHDIDKLRAALDLELASAGMKVWIYGNHLANGDPVDMHDGSTLQLMGIGARLGHSPRIYDGIDNDEGNITIRGSTIGLYAVGSIVDCRESNPLSKIIPGRLRELDSGPELAVARLQAWITECGHDHPACKPPALNPVLPTRVLDVTASDRGVALVTTKGQRGRYVALSHTWGSSPMLIATAESLEDLEAGIATAFLPKTFREAIVITKKLGIRYLWIDCLCIIQDDPLDWERESAVMGQVYHNAYLTISAANSKDSSSGCLPKRTAPSYVSAATRSFGYDQPRTSPCYCMNVRGEESNGTLYFFEEWLPGSKFQTPQATEIGTFGKRFDPLESAPLSTRGWTLQDRVLSPRTIHYAEDQMFYECESGVRCEDGFVLPESFFSFNRLLATQSIRPEQHGRRKGGISFAVGSVPDMKMVREVGGWLSLVKDFSTRRLTVPSDKLPALSGMTSILAQQTGDLYFAGIWATHMYEDLCWRTYPQEELRDCDCNCGSDSDSGSDSHKHKATQFTLSKGKVLGSVSLPSTYRAPSWSWASIDGPIRFMPLSYSNIVAKARDCKVEPLGRDIYGRVKSG
jgi:hypothetical protein